MKRKKSKEPCRIYSYGIRLNPGGERIVREELWHARDFYNDLVLIENGRRDAYRLARERFVPGYAEAEARVQAIDEEIESLRDLLRSKRARLRANVRDLEVEERIGELKPQLKEAAAALKPLRAEAKGVPDLVAESKRLDAVATGLRKNAAKHSGAFWTTKGRVSNAVQQASRSSRWQVKRRRDARTGTVGGQILKLRGRYLDTDLVFTDFSTFLQIEPLPGSTWDTRGGRRRARTSARLRIGSDGRAPRWVEMVVTMHRPLPPGCLIKNAWIKVSRIGRRYRYHLQMTLEGEAFVAPSPIGPACGVGLARRREEGTGDVQVATLVREDGHVEHLTIPASIFERLDYAEGLRSVADSIFEEAKATLATEVTMGTCPAWVADAAATCRLWRNPRHLHRIAARLVREQLREQAEGLWRSWRDERLAAGLDLYADLAEVQRWGSCPNGGVPAFALWLLVWQRKADHLRQWEADQRIKAERHRDSLMANWVAGLRVNRYDLYCLDTDLRQRRAKAEKGADTTAVRHFSREAAPGHLKALLKHAGAKLVKAPAPNWAPQPLPAAYRSAVAALNASGADMTAVRAETESALTIFEEARRLSDAAE